MPTPPIKVKWPSPKREDVHYDKTPLIYIVLFIGLIFKKQN